MSQLVLTVPLSGLIASSLHSGDVALLSGVIYTARDAAHKRFMEFIDRGEKLPVDFSGQVLYYCGPTPAKPGRSSGSAGPTTSARIDVYTPKLLGATGLRAMIGKGERSSAVIDAMIKYGCVYFAATGGTGALIAKSIRSSAVVCFEDLGPEAVFRLEVPEHAPHRCD